ncbi:MAG TPA: hypothetical protein VFF79_09025 [Conexibacter sp.]|jgi:hypothetical protein|nr:hypothetical protein [Conexibacter sp.]
MCPPRLLRRRNRSRGHTRRDRARAVARADERGQATLELVALLPLVGLLAALLWQALLAGETVWLSGGAARAAARAAAIGADPVDAARAVLPVRLERGLRVERERDGAVALVLRVPAALGGGTLASVTTRARFEAQR